MRYTKAQLEKMVKLLEKKTEILSKTWAETKEVLYEAKEEIITLRIQNKLYLEALKKDGTE
jgi:hypothetical protein